MRTIRIRAGGVTATATLAKKRTADTIWESLPFKAKANRWGDEIYFSIPVDIPPEDPQEVVEAGDLGYWPVGRALCIFWGPIPASRGEEIRPASPVNVFGRLDGDVRAFAPLAAGTPITVERA